MAGLFGSTNYGFNTGDINAAYDQRAGQINTFGNQLAAMRQQYLSQIPQLNTAAFNQFGADAAAKFGAQGMDAGSGAFQGALAREAVKLQAGQYQGAYQSGIQNLDAVNSAQGQNSNGLMQARAAGLSRPTNNPFGSALGAFAGQAGMAALGANLFGATAVDPTVVAENEDNQIARASAATPMNYPARGFQGTVPAGMTPAVNMTQNQWGQPQGQSQNPYYQQDPFWR